LFLWLGYRIPIFKNKKSKVLAVLIGFAVFTLINIIPVLGCVVVLIAAFAAAGAALQTRFGSRSQAASPNTKMNSSDIS
jgi:hypothetical protein